MTNPVQETRQAAERCLLCGAETQYTRDTPISQRCDYVEGAGQLCRRCWLSLYGKG